VLLKAFGPQATALGVLSTLLAAAELSLWTLSEIEQRNLLTVFIEQRRMQGSRVVICVDNVSRFSVEAWDEIERLIEARRAARAARRFAEADGIRRDLDTRGILLEDSATGTRWKRK